MPNRQLIEHVWRALQPHTADAKCAGCECLQGALVELRLALDEAAIPDGDALGEEIAAAMRSDERHSCLGCDPCHPSARLADYYREQARQAEQATCCPT